MQSFKKLEMFNENALVEVTKFSSVIAFTHFFTHLNSSNFCCHIESGSCVFSLSVLLQNRFYCI